MKGFSSFLTLGWLVLAMIVASPRANAQGFGLSVTPSGNSILVSNSLTYTINVTNLTGFDLADALVTNTLSAPFLYVVVTAPPQVLVFTNATSVRFDLGQVVNGGFVQITLTLQPTTTGFFTNAVVVANTSTIDTASTNVVVQVTNLVILADLGVTMTGPSQVVITNDWMTYGVTATNLGPSAASNVALTNSLPAGVLFKGIFPTNQPFTTAGSNMIFNLGTLTNGGYANLQFTVEPTNAGVLPFSASVGAAGVLDTNIANNIASTNITITNYLPGLLVAVTNSAQYINLVNGLEEQSILLSNTGTSSVTAARVVVTSLTNQLFNAVGTNNGNPFVYYSTNLAVGQSVSLLLQYFPRGPFPFTNNQLNAFEVSVPNWTPPVVTTTSTNVNISRIVELNNGWMLIEFPTTLRRTYTVVYSDNVLFSNAMIAPPSLVAPANRVQWIDYGPPTTISAPTNAGTRFYRVFQNP